MDSWIDFLIVETSRKGQDRQREDHLLFVKTRKSPGRCYDKPLILLSSDLKSLLKEEDGMNTTWSDYHSTLG